MTETGLEFKIKYIYIYIYIYVDVKDDWKRECTRLEGKERIILYSLEEKDKREGILNISFRAPPEMRVPCFVLPFNVS